MAVDYRGKKFYNIGPRERRERGEEKEKDLILSY
jgi:hypothetical protein